MNHIEAPENLIPEPLLRAADEAERRKEEVMTRVLQKLELVPDAFELAMTAVIDADRAALAAKGK